jgi:hypothetical protein
MSDYQKDDDHGYPDNSFEKEEETDDGLLIETPSRFKIIASEQQMDGSANIISPGKLYEAYDTLPPGKQSGECVPCYEKHNAMLEITDYGAPELNTSGMEKTSVGTLLPIPSAVVQVWTRGLATTNGGTVFPSEVLPPPSTAGRVARVIPPRLSPSATEDVPTNITAVEDRAALHAPCCSGGGIAAALVGMSPIMLGSLAADAIPLQLDETKLKVLWTGTPDKVDVGTLIIIMVIDVQMDLLTESIYTIWDYYGVLPVYSGQLTTGEYGTHHDIPGKKRPLAGGDWPGEPRPRT